VSLAREVSLTRSIQATTQTQSRSTMYLRVRVCYSCGRGSESGLLNHRGQGLTESSVRLRVAQQVNPGNSVGEIRQMSGKYGRGRPAQVRLVNPVTCGG
jgi:hypothetical protein